MRNLKAMFRETMNAVYSGRFGPVGSEKPFSFDNEQHSTARYFPAGEVVELVRHPDLQLPYSLGGRCQVIVCNADSLAGAEMADTLDSSPSKDKKPPLVLNFANPHEPGGGVTRGAVAQEEDLCRRTTLYASLISSGASGFYDDNKRCGTNLFTHGMILSPYVEVFRTADGGWMEEPLEVAVLTCPAPYVPGLGDIVRDELHAACKTRVKGMPMVAAANGYKSLVLGAWGCGVFGNDPNMMARAFREALGEVHGGVDGDPCAGPGLDSMFTCIVFAVLDRSRAKHNLHAFMEALGDINNTGDDA